MPAADSGPVGQRRPFTRRSQRTPPWIPRNLLEPTAANFVLGSVYALNSFLARDFTIKADQDAPEAWFEALERGWQLLEYVTSKQWRATLTAAGYKVTDMAAVIDTKNLRGMSINILKLYQALITKDEMPALLDVYLTQAPPITRPPLTPAGWETPAKRHLGSFNNQFPLSPSQREALYQLLVQPPATILPVSGPPGTGKTTLLHSVVASLWVRAAIRQENPPIIVATSTNNQAVTNVIDSFSSLDGIERWLPVSSFGLYLTNSSDKRKDAESRRILAVNKYGQGFREKVESFEFITKAKTEYLAACSRYLGKEIRGVDTAVTHLHRRLCDVAGAMSTGIAAAFRLHELAAETRDIVQEYGSVAAYHQARVQQLTQAKEAVAKWQNMHTRWLQYQQNVGLRYTLYGLLAFIPFCRRQLELRNALFVSEQMPEVEVVPDPEAITAVIAQKIKAARLTVAEKNELLLQATKLLETVTAATAAWDKWREQFAPSLRWEQLFTLENEDESVNETNLLNWLDTTLRYELFVVATHYWEGRWLQEVTQNPAFLLESREAQDQQTQENKWRRYAMLTPCFVTTMHTGPSFFTYFDRKAYYLFDFIDLLVVDEAGQVTPEVSGAMFALAKQALVVGDVQQIEPVWSIPPPVDYGNLLKHGLVQEKKEFARLGQCGIIASSGSVMRMAQQVSPYQLPPRNGVVYEPGMFLAEHRRCVPQIIDYCNSLAYGGRLRPMRPTLAEHPWPHLGYVHVKGQSTRAGGSRKNEREAQALVAWIVENQEALEDHYNAELEEIIGIVTPFAAQKRTIRRALRKHQIQLSKVGTVHALQGGERPIVLFSPVYTVRNKGTYFFDRRPNMLNVAVSRAKDSFLVFGDMDIFDPQRSTPSGLLARYLFADARHEMTQVPLPSRNGVADKTAVHHVRTLERHVRTLERAFARAKKRLVIISPYLRWRAVQADGICKQVADATKNGVQVDIFVDRDFNEDLELPAAAKAAAALRQSGANVYVCHNIHSKAICVDGEVFVEGSFNWLSAERNLEEYTRYETSIIYTGPMAAEFIDELLADVEQRVVKPATRQGRR